MYSLKDYFRLRERKCLQTLDTSSFACVLVVFTDFHKPFIHAG